MRWLIRNWTSSYVNILRLLRKIGWWRCTCCRYYWRYQWMTRWCRIGTTFFVHRSILWWWRRLRLRFVFCEYKFDKIFALSIWSLTLIVLILSCLWLNSNILYSILMVAFILIFRLTLTLRWVSYIICSYFISFMSYLKNWKWQTQKRKKCSISSTGPHNLLKSVYSADVSVAYAVLQVLLCSAIVSRWSDYLFRCPLNWFSCWHRRRRRCVLLISRRWRYSVRKWNYRVWSSNSVRFSGPS